MLGEDKHEGAQTSPPWWLGRGGPFGFQGTKKQKDMSNYYKRKCSHIEGFTLKCCAGTLHSEMSMETDQYHNQVKMVKKHSMKKVNCK